MFKKKLEEMQQNAKDKLQQVMQSDQMARIKEKSNEAKDKLKEKINQKSKEKKGE